MTPENCAFVTVESEQLMFVRDPSSRARRCRLWCWAENRSREAETPAFIPVFQCCSPIKNNTRIQLHGSTKPGEDQEP